MQVTQPHRASSRETHAQRVGRPDSIPDATAVCVTGLERQLTETGPNIYSTVFSAAQRPVLLFGRCRDERAAEYGCLKRVRPGVLPTPSHSTVPPKCLGDRVAHETCASCAAWRLRKNTTQFTVVDKRLCADEAQRICNSRMAAVRSGAEADEAQRKCKISLI